MMNWILTNSLWCVGLGLMLASSGIDGTYMAEWMPNGWQWLGYVLNSTADVSGIALTYFFGRLQQDRSKAKRRLAMIVLGGELVGVFFSWFFGWRQLLIVLPVVEPVDYQWIAPIAAAFIPLLLAFIGYAESLLVGRFDASDTPKRASEVAGVKPEVAVVKPEVTEPTIELDELALKVYAAYSENPTITKTALAELVGVSRPTVNNRLEALKAAGKFNGNGHI